MAKYECAYCGKQYEDPIDRARCEFACVEKIKEKEEVERQKKLNADKERRYKEVEAKYNELAKAVKEYNKDYGTFSFSTSNFPWHFVW
jgi:uncharacterized protein YlxW (UPF0749 family)